MLSFPKKWQRSVLPLSGVVLINICVMCMYLFVSPSGAEACHDMARLQLDGLGIEFLESLTDIVGFDALEVLTS